MKFATTLSAAALAAISFAGPAKAVDYSTCVDQYGNTSCAALIPSAVSCAYANNPRIAHWSAEKKADKAFEFVEQKWDEAGVNFARVNKNVLTRLAGEYTDDYCKETTEKTYPSRNLY